MPGGSRPSWSVNSVYSAEAIFLFLMAAANVQLSSVLARAFNGPSLASLIASHQKNLFRLPCNTLFRLNGAKRLRDAGFKMVEKKPETVANP